MNEPAIFVKSEPGVMSYLLAAILTWARGLIRSTNSGRVRVRQKSRTCLTQLTRPLTCFFGSPNEIRKACSSRRSGGRVSLAMQEADVLTTSPFPGRVHRSMNAAACTREL